MNQQLETQQNQTMKIESVNQQREGTKEVIDANTSFLLRGASLFLLFQGVVSMIWKGCHGFKRNYGIVVCLNL